MRTEHTLNLRRRSSIGEASVSANNFLVLANVLLIGRESSYIVMGAKGLKGWYRVFDCGKVLRPQNSTEDAKNKWRVEGKVSGKLLDESFEDLKRNLYIAFLDQPCSTIIDCNCSISTSTVFG